MKSFRPTLSVLTAVHGNGGLTAAALAVVRPFADEIVVAFDSRIPRDQLGPLESVADLLIGFEFSGPNRFRPWLREQARGDWLLLLDSDEVVSTELLRLIPEMISNRSVSGYVLPRWWVFPDPTTRLVSAPWGDDRHLRLARNDGRLWFPGTKHTGAEQDSPFRFLDAPIVHLDLIINSMAVRCDKVARYDDQKFPMFAPNGRLINETYYLPERDPSVSTCPMPASDTERVVAVLARREDRHEPTKPTSVVSAAEVDRWWTGCPSSQFDYAAEIAVVRGVAQFPAQSTVLFELEVENLGKSVWPETRLARGGALILLAYHWKRDDGSMAIYDGRRSALTSRVTPGERVRLSAMVDAPPEPGRYKLVFDLVYENVRWFCIDHEIGVDIEPSIREQLAGTGVLVTIPIKAARAARRRLQGPDGLAIAMQPDHDERLDTTVDLPLGGWSLDGAVLNYLLARVRRENIVRILEFGSGSSTVVLAHELASHKGMILSLDQDPAYATQTIRLLAERGLETRSRVVAIGLAETFEGGVRTQCYALTPDIERDIRAFDPDLIVIDGPSQASGASRLAVAPMIARLVERPTPFVMDDAFRDAELEIADRWQQESGIDVDGILAIGKGLLIGRLRGSSNSKKSCSAPAAMVDSPATELRGSLYELRALRSKRFTCLNPGPPMFRFVTAAFGKPYLVAARGLLRSFQAYAPSETLTIFTDMPDELKSPNTVGMSFSEVLEELEDFYRDPKNQLQNVFRFGILKRMQEMFPDDDICWIDADMLVFCNFSAHFHKGRINVMSHGRRDDQTLDCGGGLLVSGERYAIGGMYSLPPGPALEYMIQTMRSLPSWPDGGGPLRSMADQIILNHLVANSSQPVSWVTDDKNLIFNLEVSDSVHPIIGDAGLSRIKLENGKLIKDDREIVVFCWIKTKLDAHLDQDFSTFKPEVAKLLRELYFGTGAPSALNR